jgi:hypothetical protein
MNQIFQNMLNEETERQELLTIIAEKLQSLSPGGSITVDDALSTSSTNPVQNKVITDEINDIKTTLGNINTVLESVLGGSS